MFLLIDSFMSDFPIQDLFLCVIDNRIGNNSGSLSLPCRVSRPKEWLLLTLFPSHFCYIFSDKIISIFRLSKMQQIAFHIDKQKNSCQVKKTRMCCCLCCRFSALFDVTQWAINLQKVSFKSNLS